ncbi:hypothetical protein HMN09_00478900 [Mycena chlorophos]|uniref:Uncharacterized protein n=1 Tax=Mycena chlorophos TaxID=658473 RepID=A0A8H6TIR0_MYCCL|nr:hypothetical protein HMN09_00478900 [Mycena chlorophos]
MNSIPHRPISIDYAALFGIHSTAAAILFAVIYAPLGLWYVRQSIRNTTYVYIVLTIFCALREAAFIMRAIMAHSTGAGSNLGLFIADQVFFGVGFFALLYSAYTLVLDRDTYTGGHASLRARILNPLRNSVLFRLVLIVGITLGTAATAMLSSTNPSTMATANQLRKASTIIFFVLTVIQALQTVVVGLSTKPTFHRSGAAPRFGDEHGHFLLLSISVLILIRETFLFATTVAASPTIQAQQNNEKLWYPLVAMTEFIAVAVYSVSGLVPSRKEITQAVREEEKAESGSAGDSSM